MKQAGNAVGINFTGKCDRAPNSLQSHCLLTLAEKELGWQKQNELQEMLFQAYFTDGVYPDEDNLVAIGQRIGLEEAKIRAALQLNNSDPASTANSTVQEVRKNSMMTRGHGVPFFIFNGAPAFAGAQEVDTFVQVFNQLAVDAGSA